MSAHPSGRTRWSGSASTIRSVQKHSMLPAKGGAGAISRYSDIRFIIFHPAGFIRNGGLRRSFDSCEPFARLTPRLETEANSMNAIEGLEVLLVGLATLLVAVGLAAS